MVVSTLATVLDCGVRADYVQLEQIPELDCQGCTTPKRTAKAVPMLKYNNYWYCCEVCGREWALGSIVIGWSDAFHYAGLAAPGDSSFTR